MDPANFTVFFLTSAPHFNATVAFSDLTVSCVATSSHRGVRREQNQKTCGKQKQNGGGAPPEDERKAAEMPTAYHAFCSALTEAGFPYH